MSNEETKLIDLSVDALSENGNLAEAIVDFKVRAEQQKMAAEVAEAISAQHDLVVEAGTGIGKTFAYLVPALLSGKRTIVSTATRNLQDQIYYKDLPTVIDALGIDCQPALLKGRANYLCMERMKQLTQQTVLDQELADQINRVEQWSFESPDGDISSMPGITEVDPLWPLLTSTADNCLRKDCEYYDSCYVLDARKKASEANLVFVNHALLMADMTLKEEGFAKFLPDAEVIIVDEAHQLKDFAERSFTESFSGRLFMEVLREIDALIKEEGKQKTQILILHRACLDGFKQFSALFQTLGERAPIKVLRAHSSFAERYRHFSEQSQALIRVLKPYKTFSEKWANCIQRMTQMFNFIESVCADSNQAESCVAWFHRYSKSFQIHLSPVDVTGLLEERSKQYNANWVYTSATLSVRGDFSYFIAGHSDENKTCKSFASPFDYQSQAALYLPDNIPYPQEKNYTRCLIESVHPVLSMSKGRAFLLFTSYRALSEAEALLTKYKEYTLLVQGKTPKQELIDLFIKEDKALLLGTYSFWNGVDVKGDALRCVVIDRLPFMVPSDPLIQARKTFFEEEGRDFFNEYVLPEAIIALRQGVGRLIRSETDKGVVVIGDPRLRKKNYGNIFLRSLPNMRRCRNIALLKDYLE